MADMKIYQEVELSLTENLVPTVVHVKQFDHKARKIRCRLYSSSVEYVIPEGAIASCAGTRPDGHLFQYSSETAPELVFIEENTVSVTISRLKKKLGEGQSYIKNVFGLGYRMGE